MQEFNQLFDAFDVRDPGDIALLHPEISEIDLNPIIIRGDEPVVADALIILGEQAED